MSLKIDYNDSWNLIKKVFPILDESSSKQQEASENEFYKTLSVIENLNLAEIIKTMILTRVEREIRESYVPKFWSYFVKVENYEEGFFKFSKAINFIHDCFMQYGSLFLKLKILNKKLLPESNIYGNEDPVDALRLLFRATLLSQLPIEHKDIIENFYIIALSEENNRDIADFFNLSQQSENNYNLIFSETNRKLNKLDLLEPLVGQVLTSLIYTTIENHVQKTCKDSFDSSYLTTLETWLETVIIPWLQTIYCSEYASVNEEAVKRFQRKLLNFLYETYAKVRINQLFNIIIEFPESLPALEDLRLCLQKTDLRSVLIEKLQKSMETRLLHPGVSTPDILTAYVASIRSMRVLDPSGLLLETVTQPVHQYLRSRDDTVRCVVSSLTEEDPNDLAEELVRGNAVHVDENALSDEDAENWTKWMPDPVEADPNKSSNIRRSSDIISMLVSVYGSKELFVNEYRTLLADRLLSQFSCDTEKEIRYLELLKLRFGDSQLHYCEVMLKDVADSKRIKTHIAQIPEYSENFNMSAMILSAQFWPALKDEKLEVHPKIKEQMALYTKGFEALKGSRTLAWKNHLGVVDVEIDLPDRKLNLSVTPVHVTIIMHFEDKKEWALDELSRVMQVPPTILRRKMGFWQSYGLIEEVKPDLFCLIEEIENSVSKAASEIVEDYESESAMASAQDQRKEELQTFWSYITGMLMNLDSLPLERIHQMLKMFAFQGPTIECSLQELRHFLDAKVREHELVYSGGLYKLPKSDILT